MGTHIIGYSSSATVGSTAATATAAAAAATAAAVVMRRQRRVQPPFPCRVEGWLNICGKFHIHANTLDYTLR